MNIYHAHLMNTRKYNKSFCVRKISNRSLNNTRVEHLRFQSNSLPLGQLVSWTIVTIQDSHQIANIGKNTIFFFFMIIRMFMVKKCCNWKQGLTFQGNTKILDWRDGGQTFFAWRGDKQTHMYCSQRSIINLSIFVKQTFLLT